MSSALRLSIITLMLLATTALGVIAYRMTLPAEPISVQAPPTAVPAPHPRLLCREISADGRHIGP